MASGPVLVVTDVDDRTADQVIAELHERGVPVVRLDPGDFPHELTVSALIHDRQGWRGTLSTRTRDASLEDVRSVYWRRPRPHHSHSQLEPEEARFVTAQSRHGLTGVLTALPCLYVNHPAAIARAEYKPEQLAVASALNFAIPAATLITNDPDEARRFVKEHAPVVYKPLVPPEGLGALWTTEVGEDEIDDSVAATAHLFQARVDKVADVRVIVVGRSVFAVRIDADVLDWRSDYDHLSYRVVTPPPEVRRALHRYLRRFGLVFGAFDFALTGDGWVFLECNPNGQWAWMEDPTGLPMTAAFADLLAEGTR